MKIGKWKTRCLVLLLIIGLFSNSFMVNGANVSFNDNKEDTQEMEIESEKREGDVSGNNNGGEECDNDSQQETEIDGETDNEEEMKPQEGTEINPEDGIETLPEEDDDVENEGSNTEAALKINIEEITSKSIKGKMELKEVTEELSHILIRAINTKDSMSISDIIYIESGKSIYEFNLPSLYADEDYIIRAELMNQSYQRVEHIESESVHTLSNPVELKYEVEFSNITKNSVDVTVTATKDTIAYFNQNDIDYQYVTLYFKTEASYPMSQGMSIRDDNNYSATITVDQLYAGADYAVDIYYTSIGECGGIKSSYEFSTQNPDIKYSFNVDGNTIGTGFVSFVMEEGYEEDKEYSLEIYVIENENEKQFSESAYLNKENQYSFTSTKSIFLNIGTVYTVFAQVRDKSTSAPLFITNGITVEIGNTDIFKIKVLEDSVTYLTVQAEVEWMNTEAIDADEVEIYLSCLDCSCRSETAILNKETKKKSTLLLSQLKVGKKHNIGLYAKLNGKSYCMIETSISTLSYEFEKFTEVEFPSQLEIAKKWKSMGISLNGEDTYDEKVNHTNGGILCKKTLQNGTNLINFIRYAAGLPDDVVYDEEWCRICNCGSELNRINGELDHYPSKPSSVTQEFYDRGYKGTSSSNLAMGSKNLADSILLYMIDPGESNYAKGHRTWILQPYLGVVGLGKSQNFYSMYVMEGSTYYSNRDTDFSKGYYYWPAHNMPMEIYTDDYWDKYGPSLYLSEEYDPMNSENITIQVKSKKLGKTWNLKGNQGTYDNGPYMRVYGDYLVFDTGMYPKGDEVTVTVNGTTIKGEDAPIEYTMNFFSIADIDVNAVPVESVKISTDVTEVFEGESVKLTANILPEDAGNKKVEWKVESTDGKGKAVITQEGVVTTLVAGEVKVTAVSKENNAIFDSLTLKIKEKYIPVEKVFFEKEYIRIENGTTYFLPAIAIPEETTETNIVYTSSDEEKVIVEEGIITALNVTEQPVIIRAQIGELYAQCQVEVYEARQEEISKYYSTRMTGIFMEGENELLAGEEQIVKIYPLTTGFELEKEEYEIAVTCNQKYITLNPVESEDHGRWYKVAGVMKGNEKVTFTITSDLEGNGKQETIRKSITFKVLDAKSEDNTEVSTTPVLVNKNLSVNQNLELGTKIDIRFIEGNEQVNKVFLKSKKQDGTENLFRIEKIEDDYYVQTKDIIKNQKYSFILGVETQTNIYEYPISITTKRSFPKVTVKQIQKPNIKLLYENAVFEITATESIINMDFITSSTDFIKADVKGSEKEYVLNIKQLEHGKKINKTGVVSILFDGYRVPYEKKISIGTVTKTIKPDTLTFTTNKIILNSSLTSQRSGSIQIGLKNSDVVYPDKILVSGMNKTSVLALQNKEFIFTYNKNTGKLQVTVKSGVKKGSYKFSYEGMIYRKDSYVSVQGKGTLTITVSEKNPTISLKTSGAIDLIDRQNSCITYTPSIKDITGKIVAVELTKKDADYFYARVTSEGKIKLYARKSAQIIPKQNYEIGMQMSLNNGYRFPEISVKVKPKQSSFSVTTKEKTITLCKKEVKAYPLFFMVKSPKTAEISSVKPIHLPQGFVYDSREKALKISDVKKVKSGKTYSISFEISPTGAYRSVKPAKVTIKVKVK